MIDNRSITGNMNESRNDNGGFDVYIDGKPLDSSPSQSLYNHSPDGFAWGFSGSGPSQLSLALLYYFSEDRDFSIQNYQDFKEQIVSKLPRKFQLNAQFIKDWIEHKKELNLENAQK